EDGIRDRNVTGVQTCALPISKPLVCQWNVPGCRVVWRCYNRGRAESASKPLDGREACRWCSFMSAPYSKAVLVYALLLSLFLARSEERRVGKECRSRGWQCQ